MSLTISFYSIPSKYRSPDSLGQWSLWIGNWQCQLQLYKPWKKASYNGNYLHEFRKGRIWLQVGPIDCCWGKVS